MPSLEEFQDADDSSKTRAEKTESDIEEAQALLHEVQDTGECLQGFDAASLRLLAENISVFRFDESELIMQEGETASWMGIVLSGKLVAVKDGKTLTHMVQGTHVGEVAFFCGGVRFCDIRAASDGHIAAVQYHEMDSLFAREPHVALKFVHELGASAVRKNGGFTEDADAVLQESTPSADNACVSFHWQAKAGRVLQAWGLSEDDVARLLPLVHFKRFEADELLLRRHPTRGYDAVAWVLSGAVAVQLHSRTIRTVVAGEVVGELEYYEALASTQVLTCIPLPLPLPLPRAHTRRSRRLRCAASTTAAAAAACWRCSRSSGSRALRRATARSRSTCCSCSAQRRSG